MAVECKYQKGNDEYATPSWIKEGLFSGWYDPCPMSQGLVSCDGLTSVWPSDKIFINPPYSKPLPWVERAILEAKKGKTVALLLKHDHSTRWFEKLHDAGAHVLMLNERLNFNGKGAASFCCSLFVLSSFNQRPIKKEVKE